MDLSSPLRMSASELLFRHALEYGEMAGRATTVDMRDVLVGLALLYAAIAGQQQTLEAATIARE